VEQKCKNNITGRSLQKRGVKVLPTRLHFKIILKARDY
jgi:hypothetical protein